ncbi:hypothetical protein OAC52_01835 [Flavobacteriaceae bacterium]|nr:hypothetical protein [Flavobacteriaceae bacterium]
MKNHKDNDVKMDRREAINKIGDYGKYASLTALGTYLFLNPLKAQAFSAVNADPVFDDPGGGFTPVGVFRKKGRKRSRKRD